MTHKEFFEVSYDLPSENQLCLKPQQSDCNEVAALRIRAKKELSSLRFGFTHQLDRLGRYITNSVFVVPPEFEQKARDLAMVYKRKYQHVRDYYTGANEIPPVREYGFASSPHIVILGYKGEYGGFIQFTAVEVIREHLNKLLDDFDDRIIKASEKGSVNARSLKRVNDEYSTIEGIAAGFDAAHATDIANLLEQLATKIQILNNY